MRQVKFRKWIPTEYIEQVGTGKKQQVVGTGCYENKFNSIGNFHSWGLSMEETQEQIASYTIAIVEMQDGSVYEVLPNNLIFIN
jgi:hypothetical protein